jgi:hypothetical protein
MEQKTAEDLNGFEMLEMKKVLGTSIDNADGISLTYALTYVFKKRENPDYRYDDALGMTLREVQAYLGVTEDEVDLSDLDDNDPKD